MELYVLDANREQIGIIDDYKSLIWAKRYIQFGDCELYIRACEEYFSMLSAGHYLIRDDDDMVCRIDKVELDTDAEDGDYLIITGNDCRSILNQRIIWGIYQKTYTMSAQDWIHHLISENITSPSLLKRQIPFFKSAISDGLNDVISFDEQVSYANLGEHIKEVCNTLQYGSRVTLDQNNDFIFSLYNGVDRSYSQDELDHVVFSPEFDNIVSSKYINDFSNIKNAALIGGEGEGAERKLYTIDTYSGIERYELFVDARDISSKTEDDVTISDDEYSQLLQTRGLESLAGYGIVESFEGEVEPHYSYKYGVDYCLGDIVQVVNEYGVSSSARITEVIETFDQDGYSIIPTFQY